MSGALPWLEWPGTILRWAQRRRESRGGRGLEGRDLGDRRRAVSGLAGSAGGAVDGAGRVAGVAGGELHVDRRELGGLAGTPERGLAAEFYSSFSMVAPPLTCRGVQIGPGATPLTRIPLPASCLASDFT